MRVDRCVERSSCVHTAAAAAAASGRVGSGKSTDDGRGNRRDGKSAVSNVKLLVYKHQRIEVDGAKVRVGVERVHFHDELEQQRLAVVWYIAQQHPDLRWRQPSVRCNCNCRF